MRKEMQAGSHYHSKLATKRVKANLKLREIEELTGIDYRTISAWETGRIQDISSAVTDEQLNAYCKLYGIDSIAALENLLEEAYTIRQLGQSDYLTYTISPLKQYRLDRKIRRKTVVEAIGIDIPTFRNWENGKCRRPNSNTFKKLAEFYGMTEAELDRLFAKSCVINPKLRNAKPARVHKKDGSVYKIKQSNPVVEVPTKEIEKIPEKEVIETPVIIPAKSTINTKKYEDMLQRVYGRIEFEDFMILQEIVNKIKERN